MPHQQQHNTETAWQRGQALFQMLTQLFLVSPAQADASTLHEQVCGCQFSTTTVLQDPGMPVTLRE